MKSLVLITSHFPFGSGEPFLDTEFPFICREFEKTIIISRNTASPLTRKVPGNVVVRRFSNRTTIGGFMKLPSLIVRNLEEISRTYLDEVVFINQSGRNITLMKKAILLKRIIKALQLKEFLQKIVSENELSDDTVYYSYWLNSGAHALALSARLKDIRIARAHGHDLYDNRTKLGYQPLLKLCGENLNAIFFISGNGRDYFRNKTGDTKAELIVSRLGVSTAGIIPVKASGDDENLIVSCSSVIPVKRVDRISDALAALPGNIRFKWIHFGNGPLMPGLKNKTEKNFSAKPNARFEFPGHVPNAELIGFYSSHHVRLFINVSESEGIPVSIMEAQSFGIPVIATDVGGVAEVVLPGTGVLLNKDFSDSELSQRIMDMLLISDAEDKEMRSKAIEVSRSFFDAESNYCSFIRKVKSIFGVKYQNLDEL